MRILLIFALTATVAHADPVCQVERGAYSIDYGCLPALSADGRELALPEVARDGARGLPNLEVRFVSVRDGQPRATQKVLSVAEVARAGGEIDARLWATLVPRLAAVNQRLKTGGFHSLAKVVVPKSEREAAVQKVPLYSAGLVVRHEGEVVEVRHEDELIDRFVSDRCKQAYVDEVRLGESLLMLRMQAKSGCESGWHVTQLKNELKQ